MKKLKSWLQLLIVIMLLTTVSYADNKDRIIVYSLKNREDTISEEYNALDSKHREKNQL